MGDPVGGTLWLDSLGPDPLPLDTALAAVLGYARGGRSLWFRFPGAPARWVRVPAFGWSRFDAQPVPGDGATDVLIAEGLHGRLDRAGWTAVHESLGRARPLAEAAADRAAGRALWELPDDELSVLGEPGTVGAALREIAAIAGAHLGPVTAALHHRHPRLVPHVTRTTWRAMLPHLAEGDSGVPAVVRRELRANADGFAALERAAADLLGDARPTRLRLHDILLWLGTTLRLAHAVALGESTPEWACRPGRPAATSSS